MYIKKHLNLQQKFITMKKKNLISAVALCATTLVPSLWERSGMTLQGQNVGISATGALPDNSAGLDINFNNRGLLVPRLTTAQRNAIASPAHSLLIFNTTTNCYEWWDALGGTWVSMSCGCTAPAAPTANAASGISTTCFVASWTGVGGATCYQLDVSTNAGFTSFVSGYNNLNVGNVTTYNVTGLSCGTTYYYRIRSCNACGTSANSNTITVTTSCVPTATCGTQVFMAVNMDVCTQVPQSQTQSPGQKWCYNDVAANCTTYGGLYQWHSALNISSTYSNTSYPGSVNCDPCGSGGIQGICPAGYHIPTDLEWSRYEWCVETTISPTGSTPLSTFQNNIGWRGSTTAGEGPGDKMKASSTQWNGTNTSGFTALPAGYSNGGTSFNLSTGAYFWSATESSASNAWNRGLLSGNVQSARNYYNKSGGLSVRCLQN